MLFMHLTTFITPWGWFKFLRALMGLVSTGDEADAEIWPYKGWTTSSK